MGWLFMTSLKGHAGPRAYLDDQYTVTRDDVQLKVVRSALMSMRTYYAAVERTTSSGERKVFAVVCLVKYNPRDREGYIFGYKDMDETMGPYEAACPVSILDLLTPTENAHALEWRARCREAARRKAHRPKLRSGATVVFAEAITFTDGAVHDRMTVVIDPRRPRTMCFRPAAGGGLYRISRLSSREFRIEG